MLNVKYKALVLLNINNKFLKEQNSTFALLNFFKWGIYENYN